MTRTTILTQEKLEWQATRMLARGMTRAEVVAELQERNEGCGYKGAESAVRRVEAAIAQELEPHKADIRKLIYSRLNELYRLSIEDKKYSVALGAVRLHAELAKLVKTEFEPPKVGEKFGDGRPAEDLEYFIAKGHWPEEAPKQVTPQKSALDDLIQSVKQERA